MQVRQLYVRAAKEMTSKKICELEKLGRYGFTAQEIFGGVMLCYNHAQHSIRVRGHAHGSRQTVGTFRLCDEHFKALRNEYAAAVPLLGCDCDDHKNITFRESRI